MKDNFDKRTVDREFKPGDLVLAFLPIPKKPLQSKFHGPYVIKQKVSNVNYVIKTPDRRKSERLIHVNLIKLYVIRDSNQDVSVLNFEETTNISVDEQDDILVATDMKLQNSDILANPQVKLQHLTPDQREEMVCLLMEFLQLFGDAPLQCPLVEHDVELISSARPIKQHPYRVSPWKREALRKEVQFLMDHGLMEKSDSAWASPCLLVDKPDGSFRMCTDYRQVNQLTSFVTPDGLYAYAVMPFGMVNAPATFQRLIHRVTEGLIGVQSYLDDLIVYSKTWEDHLLQLRALLYNRAEAQLTVNLAKSEFCHAKVVFLGHVVGQGDVSPVSAKVEAIASLPVPQDRKAVMHYLGMTGYYRRFVPNFADVSAPLTDLVSPKKKFVWTQECQDSFVKVRALLTNSPILKSPQFNKPFVLQIDASDVGVGAVLLQYSDDDVLHPVCYASTKLKPHQKNYSTIEKECYAMIYAIEKFNVYLNGSSFHIDIYTDHNPLKFLHI
ncbi:hypothetical protein Pmani_020910 [Petrolisthes manimaculis]|uniref:Reverse transcriptase domain-containing protein n=1 Tax=Petrolisthes manimaculis TaxID=1843537 RepID=A0AAE1PFU8_9EUCA|nr:hypothetical protein Pmani_020910 [Petrolisthes manimaculis]